MSTIMSRRSLALGVAALPFALGSTVRAAAVDGLSLGAESIHQEVTLPAPRGRVYDVLTNTRKFDAVTRLSDAVELLNRPNAKSTMISSELGGEFTLFGGYVTGRHLEMRPGERLVQAWHAGSWKPSEYSIVNFALFDDGAQTKLVFDHRGFPDGDGAVLASGWKVHYWEPMAKFLMQEK